MKLNIKELLDFFDDKKDSQKGDANAISTILGEELNACVYKHFRNDRVEILTDSVLPGTNKGKRLDRWIIDNKKLYQCEIKNWAASAIGGKKLRSDASDYEIKDVADYHWKRELKDRFSEKVKHPNHTSKVLLKMKIPEKYKNISKIESLLIFWMPISSDKKGLNPLSILSLKALHLPIETKFLKVCIFSVSLYLRQIYKKGKEQKFIDLDMSHLEHRIKILDRLQAKKKGVTEDYPL